jgi:hypothetical protein
VDPDPGGPKSRGSGGSGSRFGFGSATLVKARYFIFLYNSMFVSVCYFNVRENFLLELKGWEGRRSLGLFYCSFLSAIIH